MASMVKPSSRYSSYDSRSSTSSHFSDPSSSAELKPKPSSRALVKSKPSDLSSKHKSKPCEQNFSAMVKKFMEKRTNSSASARTKPDSRACLVIPSDIIAEDLKRTARKGSNFGALHRKLFGKGTASSEKEKKDVKALTEVKGNTRTLAMVLRSERELLSLTKDQETEISVLKSMLENKNTEVEKLKDLCLRQREEIKALKNAVLFPDVPNSQLQDVLEKQGTELKQAKQLIPTLQRQVTSLTGQLQCLAEDIAEVKAEKYSARKAFHHQSSSPKTPRYSFKDESSSSELSLGDPNSPSSSNDMLLGDLNPCLTPYYAKSRSKEFEGMGYKSPRNKTLSEEKPEFGFSSFDRKLSKSSDYCQSSKLGNVVSRTSRRSDESKCSYGKQMQHKRY